MKKYLITVAALIGIAAIVGGGWIYLKQTPLLQTSSDELKAQGKEQFNKDNFDSAINNSLDALAQNNSDISAYILLASSYAQKGSVEFKEKEYGQKALETIAEAIKKDPNNSEAYRVQGYAYEIMSMWPQATESYNKAIQLDSKNAHAYANRGHMYDLLGLFDNARRDYQEAIKIDPNEEHALFNLARIEARSQNLAKAKELATKSLELSTNLGRKAEIYQVLANINLAQKDYAEAKIDITKSIELNDKLPIAYVTRGLINLAELSERIAAKQDIPDIQERVNVIVADAGKATSIYPGQTSAIVLVGKLSSLLANFDQAQKLFETALGMIDADISLGISEKIEIRREITGYIEIIQKNK